MLRHVVVVPLIAAAAASGQATAKPRVTEAEKAAVPAPVVPAPTPAGSGLVKSVQRLAPPLGCDKLTIAEGLPNSNVRAIVQDKLGFVWFGTQDGLTRYDGIKMRVFRPLDTDPNSLSSGYVTSLLLDKSGELWVGTAEHGVNLYDPNTDKFTRFEHSQQQGSLSSEGVNAMIRDGKDRVWFAMTGGGLDRYDPATKTFAIFQTKPLDAAITAMTIDASGNFWLGTASAGLIRWNPDSPDKSETFPPDDRGVGDKQINAVMASSTGKIWIGTDGDGVLELDPGSHKVVRHRYSADDPQSISDDHVSSLFEDHVKDIWIGTTNGLDKLDPSGRLVRYEHDPNNPTSIAFNGVESIYQDAGNVMWVGGFTVGICKFDQYRLRFGHHYTANLTTSFWEDADGTLWVGTYNDGLRKYDRAAQRLTIYHDLGRAQGGEEQSLSLDNGSWISALLRDRHGTLWVSLKGHGLVAFDTKTETYREYLPNPQNPNSLPVDTVFCIREDDQGKLWLATWGGGLVRFDPRDETFTSYTSDEDGSSGMSSNHLYTLHFDASDPKILWLGTGQGGVVRFNIASGSATSFRRKAEDPNTLNSDDVLSIYREPNGPVWLGTYGGGLNRLDPQTGKVEHFTTSNSGLTNNVILGLLPDADGRLWLSTNGGGLVNFDPKTKTFVTYDAVDGVQDNEFDQGSFMRSGSGELFFGGPGGFNAFNPKDIQRDPYAPPVVVTAFKVFNQDVKLEHPVWTLPKLDVAYSDSFEIQFAALSFAAPQKNRYAYKLDGFDDKFIETDRPFATYTKLGGGSYTLRVRAANRDGVWSEQPIALKIGVRPPWYRTQRAYGLYLLLLAGLVYLLYSIQRERVRRAEREGRLAVVERDLELTGAVQTGFLPDQNEISTAGMQLVGVYRPADACGGDWWWHEPLPDGRHIVMVGDVSGHGPGPAMVTAAVATAFRVLAEAGLHDVKQSLEALNREVLRVGKGRYHMTMAALVLDENTGHWEFHSAGAPPILSLGHSARHKVHFCPGAPLGTQDGFETGQVEGTLSPTDRILLYTDGIPEIALPNGNVMGLRRFAQQFELTRVQAVRDAAAAILTHADQTQGNQAQADDWTFTLIEWGPTGG